MDDDRLSSLEGAVAGLDDRLRRIEERLDAMAAGPRPRPAARVPSAPEPVRPPPVARPAAPRAAGPSPPPQPPKPPARLDVDLEDLLGGRVLAWVGGLAVLLGVVFFLVMAVRNGWVDEPTRVVLAFLGSTLLLGAGVYLYEARGRTDAALAAVSAAIAALYASLVTATRLYDLVDPVLGLGVAALVGGVATALAVRWDAPGIAALGILGALVSPVLVEADTSTATLAFMAVALVSAVGVLIWRRWDWLAAAAFVVSVPQLLVWLVDEKETSLATSLVVLALFWALYVAAAIGYELRVPTEALRPSSGALLVANALLIAGAGYFALDSEGHADGGTAWVAGVALAHIVLGSATVGEGVPPIGGKRERFPTMRRRISREIALVMLATALGLSAVAFALALDGPALVAAWAAEAVILTWLGARTAYRRAYVGAAVFLALAAGHALALEAPPWKLFEERDDWTPTLAVAIVVVASAAVRHLYRGPWPGARRAPELLAAAGLAYLPPLAFDGVAVVVLWAALAVAAAAYQAYVEEGFAAWATGAYLGLAALHTLVDEAPPEGLRTGVDDLAVAALAVGSVAAAAIAAGRLVAEPPEVRRGLFLAAAVALVYLPSLAIVDVTSTGDTFEPGQTPQVLLSAFWSLTGLAAIVVGLRRDERMLRFGGLALLGLAVVKVFLYDLSELESAYRALSFVALGLLLLAGAFAYQRLRVTGKEQA